MPQLNMLETRTSFAGFRLAVSHVHLSDEQNSSLNNANVETVANGMIPFVTELCFGKSVAKGCEQANQC